MDSHSEKLARVAFDDALGSMSDSTIEGLIGQFEDAAHNDDEVEFWYARDLQRLLGYDRWENFQNVIEKAKIACQSSSHNIIDHFRDVTKVINAGKGAKHEVHDIQLTRYASYLIAQNGDSRKKPIAFAQTYFAIQTRRQEIRDEDEASYIPLSEDKKRLLLRNEIKE
ncbi:MAG: hypothetical protein LBM56_04415, partial [Burkholderiaceae bacterium]|nr:hypothetical protein [Burkholderiaceae bacterium]